jgi:hypothetical protein
MLTWLADVARSAGLVVVEVDGWETRGLNTMTPRGIINHHTAGASTGDMPSLHTLVHGRSDLPGPLAHLGLGRSGTVYVVAAGKANHAGDGQWDAAGGDFLDFSTEVIGIEAEHTGRPDDPWPDVQLDAWRTLNAALLIHIGKPVANLCGHKEWAQPPESTPNRKVDPISLDMDDWRDSVSDVIRRLTMADVEVPGAAEGVDPSFATAWGWAKTVGIFTEYTNPDSVVTSEELAVFLDRYHQKVVVPNLAGSGLKRGDSVKLV